MELGLGVKQSIDRLWSGENAFLVMLLRKFRVKTNDCRDIQLEQRQPWQVSELVRGRWFKFYWVNGHCCFIAARWSKFSQFATVSRKIVIRFLDHKYQNLQWQSKFFKQLVYSKLSFPRLFRKIVILGLLFFESLPSFRFVWKLIKRSFYTKIYPKHVCIHLELT